MKILIRKVLVVDPASPYNGNTIDLFVEQDKITGVGANLKLRADREIDIPGLHVSPGWIDVGVQTMDPGFEQRETLSSVARAAAVGGFTGIATFPNTLPVTQGKADIGYLLNQTRNSLVDFLPIGALSEGCTGKQITEMLDMHAAGARAFSDGQHSVQDSGLLLRALQYVLTVDGLIINRPHDNSLSQEGQMHEGVVSTSLGLRGIPSLAEDMMTQRDINLAGYAGARLHLFGLSTAGSVELVRQAKANGLRISCSVPALNLAFDDRALNAFDPQFKVLPPLRSKSDQEALQAGLKAGTIDLIVSNHTPLETEAKKLEFPYAEFGAIGLETTYGLVNRTLKNKLGTEALIQIMAINPRTLLGIEQVVVREGGQANLTLFLPDLPWQVSTDTLFSKSTNSPLLGETLLGRAVAVINHGQVFEAPTPQH